MNKQKMNQGSYLSKLLPLLLFLFLAGSLSQLIAGTPGAKVDAMKIMTATATFDPVRPEAARVIADAFKTIGWDVQPNPIDYNQNVQKVIMEHDYDMWFVMLSGASLRIDPNVFINMVNHSSNYRKGGYNWEGFNLPAVDKLAEDQASAMDPQKRKKLVDKEQELIHENQPLNVVAYAQMTNAYRSDRLKNLVPMMGEGIGSFWSDINMEVKKGSGYVCTAIGTPLKNLNPLHAKDTIEFMALRMIYDRLFRIGPNGDPVPWIATSYKVTKGNNIKLKIRKGMLWHDGKPLTAEDVKFTFDYFIKWKSPYFLKQLANIEKVSVDGKYAVTIKLKSPNAPFIQNVLGGVFIIPKHIWQDIPAKTDVSDALNYANDNPVGSGPFKFDHWNRGRELKVSAFKKHFKAPKVAGIIRVVYGSHDAVAAAIEKGECDRTRYILKPSLVDDLKSNPNITAQGYSNHGFYTLTYHTRRPPLDDPIFRKAIAHVIPKELIIEAILNGYAEPGGSVIAPVNKFWHNENVKPFPNDLAKAKQILADAGYTWDSQGKLHYPKK